ncbi:MAG: alanine racemase [Nitrospinota bacterium]|nr:alanine racemase [Nitrospinota bacterium]
MHKQDVETPAPIVDRGRMERNLRRMVEVARKGGARLRPHTKTHKSPAIANRSVELGAEGITVAKLGEAEVMAAAGLDDILVAYPIVGEKKITRFLDLNERVRMACTTDSYEVAKCLSVAADAQGQMVRLLVELDCGLNRMGLPPGEPVLELVRMMGDLPGIHFAGLLTHGARVRHMKELNELPVIARQESDSCLETAELLRKNGFEVEENSIGSTPLARHEAVPGITELRPGTFIFYDVNTVSMGAATFDDCAYTILTTVVSCHSDRLVVDAGSKALSNDRPEAQFLPPGFGTVVDHPHLRVDRLSEEHGVLVPQGEGLIPKIGEKIEIIPNHVCQSVNLHDALHIVEEGQVVDRLPIEGRGKVV